ncbi:MAG: 6,7-dimethyl-8-ribityllumazine synthase [Methylacidiphilales bacterium]|nr:6,7-dimethyl-8-ribityllumazine synthase [Candidatus Methylacidiphilales bacterium]MDW8349822.1 6,7-dimethyl-8-ribityllumazine synthase [Verrucomicrobiae bacterium]
MPTIKKPSVAIVVSIYHAEYTLRLVRSASDLLSQNEIPVDVFEAPGSFEIPLLVQRAARSRKYKAIIAFGLIWQGETPHAMEILRAVTDQLMAISLKFDLPVLHGVLFVKSHQEARARCGGSLDRGKECAEAVLKLLKE